MDRYIKIEGVDDLHGATHSVISDRIEAGTFAITSAMTDKISRCTIPRAQS